MASINDTAQITEQRYVYGLSFELGGGGMAYVRTGVLTPAMGFLSTQPEQTVSLPQAAPAALGVAVQQFLARNALDASAITMRQLIRAMVNEAMQSAV